MSLEPDPIAPMHSTSVECPGCQAKVHISRAEPGIKLRCLNCGTRFDPFQASADSARSEPSVQHSALNETPSPIREPKSAGYWLLRIPAMLYFGGAMLGCAIAISIILYNLVFENQSRNQFQESIMAFAYLPLSPLSGYFAFVATRALARLESHTLKAAWNEKLIQSALPAAPGSSLPYIMPLAVCPVVIFIILSVKSMHFEDYSSGDEVTFSGIVSILCFLLAFMVDDFRQFTWRQKSIAGIVAQSNKVSADDIQPTRFPALGLFPALTVISFAFSILAIVYEEHSRALYYSYYANSARHWSRYHTQIMVSIALLIGSIALFLTGRNFRNVVLAWLRAVSGVSKSNALKSTELLHSSSPDFPARRVRLALGIFAAIGTFTLFSMFGRNRSDFIIPLWRTLMLPGALFVLYRILKNRNIPDPHPWRTRAAAFLSLLVMYALAVHYYIEEVIGYSQGNDRSGFWSFLLAVVGGNCVCLTFALIYAEIRLWRHAQTDFWQSRNALSAPPELPRAPRLVFGFTRIILLFEIAAMTVFLWNEILFPSWRSSPIDFEQIAGLPLILFLIHFPTLWVVLVTREILLVEATAAQVRAETDARIAATNSTSEHMAEPSR